MIPCNFAYENIFFSLSSVNNDINLVFSNKSAGRIVTKHFTQEFFNGIIYNGLFKTFHVLNGTCRNASHDTK